MFWKFEILHIVIKNQFLKNLRSGTQCGGFQFLLSLDLWGISFHAVVVFGLGKNLSFKSVLGHCGVLMYPDFSLEKQTGSFIEANLKNRIGIGKIGMPGSYSRWL